MKEKTAVRFTLNGELRHFELEDRALLIDVLRTEAALTGTKRSCDVQVCGACSVVVDDKLRSSCCTLAVDVQDCEVLTIEGLGDDPVAEALQRAFARHGALQCGYCTPGILMTALTLLKRVASPDHAQIKHFLHGNLCRCTGYQKILEAIYEVGQMQAKDPIESLI